MPYDRTAPRKRPEEKQVKLNLTLSPQAADLLRNIPDGERSHAAENAIVAMLSPDAKKRLIAKLNLALIVMDSED